MPEAMIRRLVPSDAEAFATLRSASLADVPDAFAASPATDRFTNTDAVRELLDPAAPAPVLGAFRGGELVGAAGLFLPHHAKMAHKAVVWGTYVAPTARGTGLGEALMRALVDAARAMPGIDWVALDVSVTATAAHRLYERLGFVSWGLEPDALRVDGRSIDVHHMGLRL
jgi:ribosomal protein S18 acetylase RimI-like enzyme